MKLTIESHRLMGAEEDGMAIMAKFGIMDAVNDTLVLEVMRQVSKQVAERYVAENFQEIVKNISPEAIANLTVAESAAKIRETLEKKIPDKVLEIEKTRTEIYQRGILGGMTRIR